MLLNIIDANGDPQAITVGAQGTPTPRAGSISDGAASQPVMLANAERSGWMIQNQATDGSVLVVNDNGGDPLVDGGWQVGQGQSFPPVGYPIITTGEILVSGVTGTVYFAAEW